jgi:uncharacterized membrane protein
MQWKYGMLWGWAPSDGTASAIRVLGWILLVVVGFWLFRTFAGQARSERPPGEEGEVAQLRERYARGEITLDEFQDSIRQL